MKQAKLFLILFIFLLIGGALSASAQVQSKVEVIQFSGIVLADDGVTPLRGAHIYVPKARRGTTANLSGFFSLPVVPGDSVIISFVGFINKHVLIPANAKDDMSSIYQLEEDTILLDEVVANIYPTETEFKKAVLALALPEDEIYKEGYSEDVVALMVKSLPTSSTEAGRYYAGQSFTAQHNRYQYQQNNILSAFTNPFAWARFIKSLKKKKKKKR